MILGYVRFMLTWSLYWGWYISPNQWVYIFWNWLGCVRTWLGLIATRPLMLLRRHCSQTGAGDLAIIGILGATGQPIPAAMGPPPTRKN